MNKQILVLTQPQIHALADAEVAFRQGKRVQVQELCARFGKTPWLLTLFKRSQQQVLVVTSYWLGALSSFENDIIRFESFKDMILIDTRNDDYMISLQHNINLGKKVVVLVSLCGNGVDKHETKKSDLTPIANITDKLVGVDEADFGAWKPQQRKLLEYLINDNDKVILMSGTGGKRAGTNINVDHYNNVTYFDMLVAKGQQPQAMKSIPDVEFYRVPFEMPHLTWNKITKNLSNMEVVIYKIFGSLFSYKFDTMFEQRPTGVMIWLPERGGKETVDKFVEILKRVVKDWLIIGIHGDIINGREVEQYVNEQHALAISQGMYGVIVVSLKLGARSFSVPSIDTVVLAYDHGSTAQTAQKMSRCLTRDINNCEKIGRVVDVTLNPQHTDNFNAPIFETAQRLSQRINVDLTTAIDKVVEHLKIYTVDHSGKRVRVSPNQYDSLVFSLYLKALKQVVKIFKRVI